MSTAKAPYASKLVAHLVSISAAVLTARQRSMFPSHGFAACCSPDTVRDNSAQHALDGTHFDWECWSGRGARRGRWAHAHPQICILTARAISAYLVIWW